MTGLRRIAVIGTTLGLAFIASVSPARALDIGGCSNCTHSPVFDAEDDGSTSGNPGGASGEPSRSQYAYAWTNACPGNYPGLADDSCTTSTTGCPTPAAMSWLWRRAVDGDGRWVNQRQQCYTPTDPPPRATPAAIFTAFKRLPMTRAALKVQPEGRTLVGLETVFYTEVEDRAFNDVDLIVEKIDFRASPEHYVWHFADGATETTTTPGAAYPHQTVTHVYEHSGTSVAPSVTVTWAGEYKRQDESTWHEVPDRVEAAGPTVQLRVASASGQLVEDPS